MKLIIRNSKIIGTASDNYQGGEVVVDAPIDFDSSRLDEYTIVDGLPVIPATVLTCSAFQFRTALNALGYRAQVEQAVAAGDQELKDAWMYAPTFSEDNQRINAMATAIGVNQTQLKAVFEYAVSVQI